MKKTDKYGVWEIRRDENCLNKQNVAPTEVYKEAEVNKKKDYTGLLKEAEGSKTVLQMREIVVRLINLLKE